MPVLCAVAFGIATGGALAKPDASLPDRDGGTPMASTDMTYLELSYATMRRQLADEALDDAAQTLSWIRRVAPRDDVASVLAAELQLRRGNVAIAAMTLLDITERQDVDAAARREAERTMSVLAGWSGLDGIIVSDAMLDQVMVQAAAVGTQIPISPRRIVDDAVFAYAVGELPATTAEQQSSLSGFADTTPAMEMAMAAGRTLSPPPAANSNIQVASALAPPPSVPDAGPRDLIDLVFDDPTNLELNFALFQQQMATGDLDGAASTLERVLLVDPRSKLAKVLMADVSIRKGDLILARNILGNLLDEEDTPPDMSERAETLLAEVETRLDPTKYPDKAGDGIWPHRKCLWPCGVRRDPVPEPSGGQQHAEPFG